MPASTRKQAGGHRRLPRLAPVRATECRDTPGSWNLAGRGRTTKRSAIAFSPGVAIGTGRCENEATLGACFQSLTLVFTVGYHNRKKGRDPNNRVVSLAKPYHLR